MLGGTSSGLKPATDWRKEKYCKHNRGVKDSSIRGAFLFNRIKMFQRAFLPFGVPGGKAEPRAEVASDNGLVRGNEFGIYSKGFKHEKRVEILYFHVRKATLCQALSCQLTP